MRTPALQRVGDTAARRGSRRPRVGALDGLRGFAIAGVLLYHGGVGWFRGGFLGVDTFFVLSGYLITSLLLNELVKSGGISLRAFWARRARRLFPALLLMLVAVATMTSVFVTPQSRSSLRLDGFATLAYVANWRDIFAGHGYFAQYANPSPLLHTWSLSIEEQFYLLWPLVIVFVGRRVRAARGIRFAVAVGALVGAAGSALLMAALYRPAVDTSRLYFGTDTRAQSLLIGAVFAALLLPATKRTASAVARSCWALVSLVAGVAVLAICVTTADSAGWLYQGGFAVFALLVALVIAGTTRNSESLPARVLSVWPLRALGRISYGVYLWHWPIYLWLTHARTGLLGLPLLSLRILLSLGVAIVSFTLVEQPILNGRPARRTARAAVPVAIVSACAVLVSCTVAPRSGASLAAAQSPASSTSAASSPTVLASHAALAASAPAAASQTRAPTTSAQPRSTSASSSAAHAASTAGGTSTAQPANPPVMGIAPPAAPAAGTQTVVLVGDSVALTLGEGLSSVARGYGVNLVDDGILGCGITTLSPYRYFGAVHQLPPQCLSWPATWRGDVARAHPAVVAILVGRWEVMDQQLGGNWQHVGQPAMDAYLTGQLQNAYAAAASSGAQVVFLTAPYYHRGERPDGGSWPEDDPRRADAFNVIVRSVAATHPGRARVVELGNRMNGGGTVYVSTVDGVFMRYDGVHVTPQGARWLAPWLLPQLRTS